MDENLINYRLIGRHIKAARKARRMTQEMLEELEFKSMLTETCRVILVSSADTFPSKLLCIHSGL